MDDGIQKLLHLIYKNVTLQSVHSRGNDLDVCTRIPLQRMDSIKRWAVVLASSLLATIPQQHATETATAYKPIASQQILKCKTWSRLSPTAHAMRSHVCDHLLTDSMMIHSNKPRRESLTHTC